MRRRPVSLCALVAAATASLSACGVLYPEVEDDRLVVMVPLNPDWAEHRAVIWPVYEAAEPPQATVNMYRGDAHSGSVSWTLVATATEPGECNGYISLRPSNHVSLCLDPGAPLDPGAAYMVEVMAEGYRTARGHTLAVGDFDVETAVLTRTGASARLDASWTGSVAAHRYFVSLRKRRPPYNKDPKAWYAEVDDTSVTMMVPDSALDNPVVPLILDVAAVSKEHHAYLTSGTGGSRFSVPPVQNIENGFGFVGSMRVRSLLVSTK